MALIVYNRENSRPQEVTYKGKRTINLDSRGTVYLSKTMSIELGILGGGRVNFAHDDETGDWYICRADDKMCIRDRISFSFIIPLSINAVRQVPLNKGNLGVNPVSYTHLDVYKRQVKMSHLLQ